jgi:hypothetical protein
MREQLCIANNHRRTDALYLLLRNGLQYNLWTDPCGVANCDTNPWQMLPQTELSLRDLNVQPRNTRTAMKGGTEA